MLSGELFPLSVVPQSPTTSDRLRLTLPWPPSVNSYWGTMVPKGSRRAIRFMTDEARAYAKNVEAVVLVHFGGRPQPLAGEVLLDITLHPPDNRRRDADNFNKGIWDALTKAGVFVDDCQVQSYRVTKGAVVRGGLVIVEIWERSRRAEAQTQS